MKAIYKTIKELMCHIKCPCKSMKHTKLLLYGFILEAMAIFPQTSNATIHPR